MTKYRVMVEWSRHGSWEIEAEDEADATQQALDSGGCYTYSTGKGKKKACVICGGVKR